jgi:phosphate acetyltransferase
MPRTLLVAPTAHRVGLTSVCLGLVSALERLGVAVGFAKPIAQPRPGDDGREERSPALVRLLTRLEPPEPVDADHAEALLSAGRLDDLMEDVVRTVGELADCDVVVIEGLVPSSDRVWSSRVNAAMVRALDADVVLVGDGADGTPGHVAATVASAASPYRSGERTRLAGCIVNRTPDCSQAALETLREEFARRELPLVGVVPSRPELLEPRVRDVARALKARALVEGDQDRRVSEVIVCAQAVPGLLPLLQDGRLLLVPGDRDEVVMAACLAALNGVRLAGLILTAGIEPDPEVTKLTAAAASTGLPILVVDSLTYHTAVAVHGLNPELPTDDRGRARAVAGNVAEHLEADWVEGLPAPGHRVRLTPAAFRHRVVELARAAQATIVLPEGAEPRTLQAATVCAERGIARCLLLGDPDEVARVARAQGLTLPGGVEVQDPAVLVEKYVERLVELRGHKGVTADVARERLGDPITVGTMMLEAGEVDGLVAGAVHTTAATVRPALELVRVAPDARLVSSIFFMCLPDEVAVYGDCAINPDPDAEQLADIAIQSAGNAEAFGIEPRVAMISFSTGSSGAGTDVEKVAEATRIARERRPDLAIDGPLQYDAAAVASVARSKAPDSEVAGRATVFVFPDLNTGNTTYKAVQRNAGVVSIGPMLQGLAKPVNDLSRGALVEDIVFTIALTAIQAAQLRTGQTAAQA